ncbi:hypothetical protein H6P81_016878 [Aristolochia fimbriata]|uniref:Uncharacterized protein n=1 Tax=Aristolochia fimbriata TaxID=158543 RepID=A0AAV7DYF4_ARIFI|nr:hypothetical protein H6P81_016878 [Aristolochia fimbriata]
MSDGGATNRRSLVGFVVLGVVCCLVGSVRSVVPLKDPHWHPATATWYGDPDGDGSDGGACGYGSLVDVRPMRARVGAVSPVLFRDGEGCGACYKVKCLDSGICSRRAVTIIVTDECPGGYCAFGRTHFDLSGSAFGRMAVSGESSQLRNRGEISVVFRRTPCKYPGKNVAFHVNEGSTDYWLSLLVEFEGGDGDIGSMHIRQASSPNWMEMKHLWGANCFSADSLPQNKCLILWLHFMLPLNHQYLQAQAGSVCDSLPHRWMMM